MATTDVKYTLNFQLADNKDDKIAVIVSAGTADKTRIERILAASSASERLKTHH